MKGFSPVLDSSLADQLRRVIPDIDHTRPPESWYKENYPDLASKRPWAWKGIQLKCPDCKEPCQGVTGPSQRAPKDPEGPRASKDDEVKGSQKYIVEFFENEKNKEKVSLGTLDLQHAESLNTPQDLPLDQGDSEAVTLDLTGEKGEEPISSVQLEGIIQEIYDDIWHWPESTREEIIKRFEERKWPETIINEAIQELLDQGKIEQEGDIFRVKKEEGAPSNGKTKRCEVCGRYKASLITHLYEGEQLEVCEDCFLDRRYEEQQKAKMEGT